MILSREFISLFRKLGLIYINPFNPDQLNPNSYDVCLGNWYIDTFWNGDKLKFGAFAHLPDNERMSIPNNNTRLSLTKERIGSRFCIVPEIRAKSSTRRSGITICDDAGFGDIGYYDFHWTVELTAHVSSMSNAVSPNPYLVVGQRFAQVVFFLSTPTLKPYKGQYSSNDFPNNMIPKKYR